MCPRTRTDTVLIFAVRSRPLRLNPGHNPRCHRSRCISRNANPFLVFKRPVSGRRGQAWTVPIRREGLSRPKTTPSAFYQRNPGDGAGAHRRSTARILPAFLLWDGERGVLRNSSRWGTHPARQSVPCRPRQNGKHAQEPPSGWRAALVDTKGD